MQKVKTETVCWPISKIVDLLRKKKIHPNPIGQRPPVTYSYGKSTAIVESLIDGYGVGIITVRDIREDAEMQKVYPGFEYLVIDGGHRVRAIRDFMDGRFKAHKKSYAEIAEMFEELMVPFSVAKCTSKQAIAIFHNVNNSASVNPIEMIMCDDESDVCRYVRSRTSYVKEYDNKPLPIFETKLTAAWDPVSEYFMMAPNYRREWDKWVFVAIHKVLGGGNVDAGEGVTTELIDAEYAGDIKVTKSVLNTVDRFFDDVHRFQKAVGSKLRKELYNGFQVVWFELYQQNKGFVINDFLQFRDAFHHAFVLLSSDKNKTYNNQTISWNGKVTNVKDFVKNNIKNYANGETQSKCAQLILKEMGDNIGVTFRDTKRSITRDERAERLAVQKYRCAIDDEPLTLEDSVWGHDTPWSQGGRVEDGAVVRKNHNIDMGCLTLNEYRMILAQRKEKAA